MYYDATMTNHTHSDATSADAIRAALRTRLPAAGAILTGVVLAASGVAGASGGSVSLVAYSTPKPAFTQLIQAFVATEAGAGATFSQSYAASGAQATAVTDGLAADVVNFSTEPDMAKLVSAGIVAPTWNKGATKGMVTDSIVSFIVRVGNPKHIKSWADLIKPGVKVITPNPFSSGSAKWNLIAAYGAELALGKSPAKANGYLARLLKNTIAQPTSASNALQTFLAGQGDVLLDYEDDALYAKSLGAGISIVTPPQTILIENPIALTKVGSANPIAKAFVSFLESVKGQTLWAKLGYRPVLPKVAAKFKFAKSKDLFTISSLGGWTKVDAQFFDPTSGAIAKIESGLGVSTASK